MMVYYWLIRIKYLQDEESIHSIWKSIILEMYQHENRKKYKLFIRTQKIKSFNFKKEKIVDKEP